MPMVTSDSFARPADTTAYADGDLVANSTTAGSVEALTLTTSRMVGQGTITRLGLYKSAASATNANFTVHLFTSAPAVTNGDNGAAAFATAVNHIGSVDCDMATGGLPGTVGLSKYFAITGGITFDLTGAVSGERRLYALIEANAAYTPASAETFRVTLEIQNGT